jgi:hypothetical protein
VEGVDVYTDTDWAGCPKTRKSTSGGCVMLGSHAIKHWSSTQTSVALSSGEAEFAGVIRGAGQGLGYKALLRDLGVEARLRIWTDSSAAIGICNRQGLGKLRHLDTHTLWIQQAVRTGRIDLRKVLGEENPADLLTKHSLSRQRLEKLVALHGCKYLDGRASSAPQVREGDSTKATMASLGGGLIAAAVSAVDVAQVDIAPPAVEPSQADPAMPHLVLFGQALDNAFPPMTAPKDEDLQDADLDEDDATLQVGLREAVAIAAEARDQGRKRKMSPITHTSTITNKETKDVVKLLEDKELATIRSALGRRRSKRKVLEHPHEEVLQQPFAGFPGDQRRVLSDAKLRSSLSLS